MIRFRSAASEKTSREAFRRVFHRSLNDVTYEQAHEQARVAAEEMRREVYEDRRRHERRATPAANAEFNAPKYESSLAWLEARQRLQSVTAQPEAPPVKPTLQMASQPEPEAAVAEVAEVWTRTASAGPLPKFKKSPPRAPRTINAER
ncbi:MAG TPA: hypothetical protein VJU83_00080 [Burkholderiales bacterium]|nr:hypothetical protein [Burkholderiales bacterium]